MNRFLVILTFLFCLSEQMIVPFPSWMISSSASNGSEAKYDILLIESILQDFLNFHMNPMEREGFINLDPLDKQTLSTMTTESNHFREFLSYPYHENFQKFFNEALSIGNRTCSQKLIRIFDTAASSTLIFTLCNKYWQNSSQFDYCSDSWFESKYWAHVVMDSWGRPASGIYSTGPFFWLGSYEQCKSVYKLPTAQHMKYCRANLVLNNLTSAQMVPLLHYGFCLPVECSEDDIEDILNLALYYFNIFNTRSMNYSVVECDTVGKQIEWTFEKFINLFWVMSLIFFVILGTSYNLFIKKRSKTYQIGDGPEKKKFMRRINSSRNVRHSLSYLTMDIGNGSSIGFSEAPSIALTYKSVPELQKIFDFKAFFGSIIHSFSINSSFRYLFRTNTEDLLSLHFLKAISSLWIVIGHSHIFSVGYIGNARHVLESLNSLGIFSQILLNATLAIDTFLLVSGTALAYTFRLTILRRPLDMRERMKVHQWMILYFHRLIRIVPSYLFVYMLLKNFFNSIGNGPMWSREGIFGMQCGPHDWWRHFSFVVNFFPNSCLPWMWYMSLDSQLYAIAPLFLSVLLKREKAGIILTFIVMFLSMIYRLETMIHHNMPSNIVLALIDERNFGIDRLEKIFTHLYAVPQARIGPFVVGLVLGWILSKWETISTNIKSSVLVLTATSFLSFSLFGSYFIRGESIVAVYYGAIFRVMWAIGVAIFIWLCEVINWPIMHKVLKWRIWIIISRLSLGIYLTHEPLILYYIWSRREPIMPTSLIYFSVFGIEIFVLSLLTAFIIAVLIEIPSIMIEKKIFKRWRHKKKQCNRPQLENKNCIAYCIKLIPTLSEETCRTGVDVQELNSLDLIPTLSSATLVKDWLERGTISSTGTDIQSNIVH